MRCHLLHAGAFLFIALAAARADIVTARVSDADAAVPAERAPEIQRLAVGLLTSSRYEAPATIATRDRWDDALRGSHVRLALSERQTFAFTFPGAPPAEDRSVAVHELVIPLFPTDYALVRDGNQFRAFAKFSPESVAALKKALELSNE